MDHWTCCLMKMHVKGWQRFAWSGLAFVVNLMYGRSLKFLDKNTTTKHQKSEVREIL